jgi:hypothetical protein
VDAHDATRTHYCRQPGCTNEARSDRGPYSKCDEHRAVGSSPRPANGSGLVSELAGLQQAARRVDRLSAKAAKLTAEALEAKREADAARAEFSRKAAAILGE